MRAALALLLALLLTPPTTVLAQGNAAPPDFSRFVTHPLPPLEINRDGQPDGAVLEVLRELCARMNQPYAVEFLPFPRALAAPRQTPATGFAGASRIPEREALYKWIGPLIHDEIVLATRKDLRRAPTTLDDARPLRIGVLLGGHAETRLRQLGFENLERTVDYQTGARMLKLGRIDAWAASRLSIPYMYRMQEADPTELDFGAIVTRNDVYLAASVDIPNATIAAWQKALDRMHAQGRVTEITNRFRE